MVRRVVWCLCLCLAAQALAATATKTASSTLLHLRGGASDAGAAAARSPARSAGGKSERSTDHLRRSISAVAALFSAAVAPCFGRGGATRNPGSFSSTNVPRGALPGTGARVDSLDSLVALADSGSSGEHSMRFAYDSAGMPVWLPADVGKRLASDSSGALQLKRSPSSHGVDAGVDPRQPAFEVLLDCLPAGAAPDRVQVVLHRKYCRTRRDDVEKGIEAEWNRLAADEPRMWWYDGTLFRLASSQRWLDVDGTQEIKLECGITRYRSFLGTNMGPRWDSIPQGHMSNPLGCFVLVHTSDRYIMLVSRTEESGDSTAPPSYMMPGGHISADRAGIFESMVQVPIPDQDGQEVNCMLGYSIWPGSERWRADTGVVRPYQGVVQELFSCPVREACADLGMLATDFLDVPLLFGITQARKNRIMSAVFYLATNLTSEEVKIRHRDATNTSSACVALHEKDAIPTVDLSITSCCRGALYLFAQWRRRNMQIFGEEDALAIDTAGGGVTRKANGADEDGAQRRGLVTPLVKPRRSDSNSSFQFGQWGGGQFQGGDTHASGDGDRDTRASDVASVTSPAGSGGGGRIGAPGVGGARHIGGGHRHIGKGGGGRLEAWQAAAIRSMSPMPTRVDPMHAFPDDLSFRRSESVIAGSPTGRRSGGAQSDMEHEYEQPERPPQHELVAALYKWLSTRQDPEFMAKAVKKLGMQDRAALTEEDMLAVMQLRLRLVERHEEDSSSSSSSSDSTSSLSVLSEDSQRIKDMRVREKEFALQLEESRKKSQLMRKKRAEAEEKKKAQDKKDKEHNRRRR